MSESGDFEIVRLVSSDGHEFVVEKKIAMVSGTIKSMLSGPGHFTETQLGVINFKEISTPILEKVIQYFHYKMKHSNSTQEIPDFPIEPEIALELLMAANFLDT
mmetsp:Transcript_23493/g.58814  ORF Transcript_23493/g.58814 Transcript_23493/m.58814 type:complete len:104 (-) Transcript_23493:9-320(-)|eukprot:CAMPEP_0177669086 /NCGR_PEP_ID=MMETSP0447-20121125/23212_1 /TAXON_ID=0 /ORGANISM="Stygamoeba regulata, Strain BSH-02190019" /LENGTH=103 /DNA_ID=CAMNT_0019175847 /DNA_START=47 /DNA_END=355 /DNA_ORIENTATION=-